MTKYKAAKIELKKISKEYEAEIWRMKREVAKYRNELQRQKAYLKNLGFKLGVNFRIESLNIKSRK